MEFSWQEYQSGFPFPSSEDHPHPGIEPTSPALAGEFFTFYFLSHQRSPRTAFWESLTEKVFLVLLLSQAYPSFFLYCGTIAPALKGEVLNHWATREVPETNSFLIIFFLEV